MDGHGGRSIRLSMARLVAPGERARAEMAGIEGWCRLLGAEFDPLR